MNEIELALSREAKLGGAELLIPVLLDGYALSDEWQPEKAEHKEAMLERVVADFSDESKFGESLAKLIKALRKKRVGAE